MRKNWPWLVALALAVWGAWSYASRVEFEKRARAAERFATARRNEIRVLDEIIERLASSRAARTIVIREDRAAVAAVDRATPPPEECAPNLAARDKVIADQAAQIAEDEAQIAAERAARAKLQASHDAVRAALDSRPRGFVRFAFLEIGKPALAPFVGLDFNGRPTAGIGIAIPIRIGG